MHRIGGRVSRTFGRRRGLRRRMLCGRRARSRGLMGNPVARILLGALALLGGRRLMAARRARRERLAAVS